MKKILTILFLFIGTLSYGQLDTVNIGTGPNSHNGDPLRTAFIKINEAIRHVNHNDSTLINTVALETIVTLQTDTVELFVFLGGGANAGDTISFTTSTVYGSYRAGPSDTAIITSINAVMIAGTTPLGTDTLGIQIYFNDSINVTTGGSVRLLNSATLGINSVTTGTVDASFANNTIYPGERVFCKSPGVVVGRIPIYFECTVYGYIRNRKY